MRVLRVRVLVPQFPDGIRHSGCWIFTNWVKLGIGMMDSDVRRLAGYDIFNFSTKFAEYASVELVQGFHWQVLH